MTPLARHIAIALAYRALPVPTSRNPKATRGRSRHIGIRTAVLEYMRAHGRVTRTEIGRALPYNRTGIGNALRRLTDAGLLARVGRGEYIWRRES